MGKGFTKEEVTERLRASPPGTMVATRECGFLEPYHSWASPGQGFWAHTFGLVIANHKMVELTVERELESKDEGWMIDVGLEVKRRFGIGNVFIDTPWFHVSVGVTQTPYKVVMARWEKSEAA